MTNNIFREFGDNPLKIFLGWYAEAEAKEPSDYNAVTLATANSDGRPAARVVLLKHADEQGFAFFTNFQSRKGQDLVSNPFAEMNFYWKSLEKQIRIAGPVVKTSSAESDAYFASRPRESQIGAWASSQTMPVDSYEDFQKRVQTIEADYHNRDIPRPPHWGGFRLKPERMEFWIAMPHRLHKRFVFEKRQDGWDAQWLFP